MTIPSENSGAQRAAGLAVAPLMDLNMPRLNGITATARIKQAFPHVVVIGLSIYATDETRQIMRAAGATTVISKDLAVEQLRDEIFESVNRRSTASH